MFPFLKKYVAAFGLMVAVGGLALTGCGSLDRTALGSDPQPDVQIVPRATKGKGAPKQDLPSPDPALVETGVADTGTYEFGIMDWFKPREKKTFGLWFERYIDSPSAIQVAKVKFTVLRKAVDQDTLITMDVTTGTTLDDIQIAFEPSGLVFNTPAYMEVILYGDLSEAELTASHIKGDGTILAAYMTYDGKGNKMWVLAVEVPGFSRYGFGGGQ